MDFSKALTYPFDDEDWFKKLAFLFIGIIPILGAMAIEGWTIETARNVRNGVAKPLASWDDFGAVISRGVPIFLARIVYFLPAAIFFCGAYGIPLIFGTAAAAASNDSDAAGAAFGGMGLVGLCCGCIGVLVLIAAGVTFWGGVIRYMDKPEFGTFMQFGENFGLVQANIGDFGMALLYMIGAGFITSLVSATVIGGLLAFPFLSYFGSHILGQLAAKIGGGAPAAAPQM